MIDPKIVEQLVQPHSNTDLTADEEELLRLVAEGKPIKAIAASQGTTPAAVNDAVEALFLKLSQGATAGATGSLKRLRMLHTAIMDREEQGETLSRLLPTGLAEKVRREGGRIGETEELVVTVLMSDVRGYSAIAEREDPSKLASQLNEHRAEMNRAILDQGGTVMQFIGDAVMACFGAPVSQDDHADRAVAAAIAMLALQRVLNEQWESATRSAFGLGIGLSTGPVAAALLGSEERLEYTLVGDTVNLSQRLQDLARPQDRIVLSDATYQALSDPPENCEPIGEQLVKGRQTPVFAYLIDCSQLPCSEDSVSAGTGTNGEGTHDRV